MVNTAIYCYYMLDYCFCLRFVVVASVCACHCIKPLIFPLREDKLDSWKSLLLSKVMRGAEG